MGSLRIAIVGCGAIAEKHVASIAELGREASVVALCDLSAERLERFASPGGKQRFPGSKLYTDVGELLRDSDAELVVVATSSDSHAALSVRALRAGKHVLVEKPLALSLEEAAEAVDEAKRRGLTLAVSFQARYMPQMAALKEAVEEGRFGKIGHGTVSLRWNRNMGYYKGGPWREDWSKGGGLFMNQCIHYVDLLLWLMGPVASVYALGAAVAQPIGVENVGAALLKFENGAIGMIEASTNVYPQTLGTSIGLFGASGTALIEGPALGTVGDWRFEERGGGPESQRPETAPISHTPLYRDLIRSIRSGEEPLVSAAGSLAAIETVLAIYRSISSGAVVELPDRQFFHMGKMSWMG
ncbi:Gfo/Idh/MocA family oxidoreductase [Paenibacillus sp. LHD-117]|uniref:Gfo/Idh/MocA family protein n=1 Tax=Paenibacillus sp. LHD-117 TaxID=3071412 RepID=UPI0027E0134F|nr:Gfo/Idh/MocA family oxidoreductase [Paenibacillus sp. LHD-117]MDQ6418335.1 Gfo/Idh/MocA family oxidoreductase [Paenibacillus sp. LHD-117]